MVARAAEIGGGHLDLLFNNAGAGLAKWFGETTNEDWKFAFDINFYGPLYGVRAALPIMIAQGGGHIANTASALRFLRSRPRACVQQQIRFGEFYVIVACRILAG